MKTISSLFDVGSEDIIIEPGYKIGNSYIEKIDNNEIWMNSKGEHLITEEDAEKYAHIGRMVSRMSEFIFKNDLRIQPQHYKAMDFKGTTFYYTEDVEVIDCGKIENLNLSQYWKSSYLTIQINNPNNRLEFINSDIQCSTMTIKPSKFPKCDSKSKIFIDDIILFAEPSQYLNSLIDEASKLESTWDPVPEDLLNKIFNEINYDPNNKNIRFQRFRSGKYNSRMGLEKKKGKWYKA